MPIPVRRCGKGWTLVGKPSSAKAYCARTDGGQKSTEPATCYGGMCSEYHLELEVRRETESREGGAYLRASLMAVMLFLSAPLPSRTHLD